MAEFEDSAQAGEGAGLEWEPMNFGGMGVGCGHDRLHARECSKAFGTVVSTVAAGFISSEGGVRISDVADDVIDCACPGLEFECYAFCLGGVACPDAGA